MQALSDAPELNVAVVGSDLSQDVATVEFRGAMEILVSRSAVDRLHVSHPEMVCVGAERVDGLFEADFDFEPVGVDLDDGERVELDVGGEQDHTTARGVIDQDESNQRSSRTPEEIDRSEADHDLAIVVDGTGCGGETGGVSKAVLEPDLLTVESGSAPAKQQGTGSGMEGDGGRPGAGDELVTALTSGRITLPEA